MNLETANDSLTNIENANVDELGRTQTDTQSFNSGNAQQVPDTSPLVMACQLGDFRKVNELITSGEASAKETAPDGVTPLHWAAINNRLNICRYLLDRGAEVDAKGGGIQGTPLHWACRNGLVYIAHLLISRGADPLCADSQGFNALHLAVHSSNVLLVIYLLHLEMPVEPTDNGDRTPLHWAAYQGDALTVDALLNWGADTKPTDEKGFTPLHWAIVKGSKPTIKRLIEGGSDVFALSVSGKTPRVMAEEIKTTGVWQAALIETGRDPITGAIIPKRFSLKSAKLIMFFTPYFLLFFVLEVCSSFSGWISVPLSLASILVTFKLLGKSVLPSISTGPHAVMQTPIFSGIFSASAFWVLVQYFLYIAGVIFPKYPLTNLIFIAIFGIVVYSFFTAMFADPGYIPPLGNVAKQRDMIYGLIDAGEYDTRHFCISTYVRKPLRARYDRAAKRVVAKYDHYCPWSYNVVGVRNHRIFLVFIVSLAIGIPMYISLFLKYAAAKNLVDSNGDIIDDHCSSNGLFGGVFCHAFFVDYFGSLLTVWTSLNCIWVYFLAFVQLVQVARGMTTNESSNLHKYGYMGGDDFSSLPADHSSVLKRHHHGPLHSVKESGAGCMRSMFRLFGIDQFIATARDAASISLRPRGPNSVSSRNPADLGAARNCTDFWFPRGSYNLLRLLPEGSASFAGNPVDYYRMWDFPTRENSQANAAAGSLVYGENGEIDLEEGHGLGANDTLLNHDDMTGKSNHGASLSTTGLLAGSTDGSSFEMVSKN